MLTLLVVLAAFSVRAQTGANQKSNSMNDFFGFDGLRLNNPDLLYNQQFLKDSTYFYERVLPTDEFLTFKKIAFNYDKHGRLTVENEFEKQESLWIKMTKRLFNYDNNGLVESSEVKKWDINSNQFEYLERTSYTRNHFGLVTLEISEVFELGEWRLDLRQEFFYNDHNDVSEEWIYEWVSESMLWQPIERKLYEYTEEHEWKSEIHQVWGDATGAWLNKSVLLYEYNEDNQLSNLSQSIWIRDSGEWVTQSIQALSYTGFGQVENSSFYDVQDTLGDAHKSVEATYDEEGNLSVSLFKEWNTEQSTWNSYEKHVHFWSEYVIGNLEKATRSIKCFYINPHKIGLPWYCDGLLNNETYHLSVFDHNGVLHHSQQFRGSDTFRLTKSLNNGLYMIVISGGLTTHTEKILIKN